MYVYKVIGQKNESGFKKGKNWVGFYNEMILIRVIPFIVQSEKELEDIVSRLNELNAKIGL
jgi:hypothetical protein